MKTKPDYVALILQYESAGLKQREFCEQHKIPYSTFQLKLSKYRKTRAAQNSFLPVRIVEQKKTETTTLSVEILYLDGTLLKMGQLSPEMIKQFLPAFQS